MKSYYILVGATFAACFALSSPVRGADISSIPVAGRAKASQYGPFRSDPAQGTPKHAYSPFDKLNQPPPYQPAVGSDFLPGKLAIKLKPASPAAAKLMGAQPNVSALQQKFASYGVTALERVFPNAQPPAQNLVVAGAVTTTPPPPDLTRWLRARCATNLDVQELVKQLAQDPDVDIAEPDYIRRPAGDIPTGGDANPLFTSQWHLAAAKVPEAWAYLDSQGLPPGGNRDIIVAVIDTGVDYTHPDLAANMWVNSREIPGNGIDDDGNGFVDDVHGCTVVSDPRGHSGDPQDDHGHGTHVAGILAAQANNGQGGVGVAYNVQILAIKAAQYSGVLTTTDIAEGVNYAVANGADIVNMSFGGYIRSQVEEDALAVAFGQCVLVAAAGNDATINDPKCSGRPMFPAAYNWVLGVMASTPSGELAAFSNTECIPRNSIEYELMAPGVDIVSALPNGQYAPWDGTSMAAPIVSGIAALARTQWSAKDVYTSRFIMGQVAANAGAGANAFTALTVAPRPELSYLEHWTFDTPLQATNNDSDGIVDAGETVDLAIVIRNHWGQASNVVATLESWADGAFQPDPYVTWLTNTVNYGAVGSFNIDDNGLIYSNQVITGVRHPFRFFVTNTCPNDHVIPLKLTLTCQNGLDPTDTTTYSAVSRFFLIVQRGRELPRIISQDMTLTKDDYWLLPDATLIEAGVTVTVTEGTQIQFWSGDPNDPYHGNPNAYLQVEGNLIVNGSASDPVDLFQWDLFPEHVTTMRQEGLGKIRLTYARVRNARIYGSTAIEHCFFYPDAFGAGAQVYSPIVTHSIFHKCIIPEVGSSTWRENLFDSCSMLLSYTTDFQDNVLLKNYRLARTQWGDRQYVVSQARDSGMPVDSIRFLRALFPTNVTSPGGDKTYFVLPSNSSFDDAQQLARYFGGHLLSINDATENEFLKNYRQQFVTEARFNQLYPFLTSSDPSMFGSSLWSGFSGDWLMLGLNDRDVDGIFVWSSGEPVSYTNWFSGEPNSINGNEDYGAMHLSGEWSDFGGAAGPWVCEVPGIWSQAQIDVRRNEYLLAGSFNTFTRNAILNVWWDPDINHWLKFSWRANRYSWYYLTGNYWGTTATTLIDTAIIDFNDDFNTSRCIYEPPLPDAPDTCYPFVESVTLSTAASTNVSIVGAERVTFTVTFNRDMNTSIQPNVSFGPDVPYTDFSMHPVEGGWRDARNWVGTHNITPLSGDGYQFIRIADAVAADDPWLVTGDDSERFRFEIITSGTESMNLQATGGEGKVDLSWMQDDFDLLAGYQLYRSTNPSNTFSRINAAVIPSAIRTFTDTNVQPGVAYYYKFSVVKTDMIESTNYSNVAEGTPLDTIPPELTHTPLTSAAPGMPLTLTADATDNVGVEGVTLHFRTIGTADYTTRTMTRTTGSRYAATIEGSRLLSPGVEYYIEATDGISMVRSGRPEYPWQVTVVDRPVVNVVTPNSGPASGGTFVTIAGSNFKTNATVSFGGIPAETVTVVSANQITCVTAAHFPATVDVQVTNPDTQSGVLLRGYTYQSEVASLSLPNTGGPRYGIVQVPINTANVQGLAAASLTVTFDPAGLRGVAAHTGSLTPGWSVAANTNTPGQLRLSMASPGGTVSGGGVLAYVELEVLGSAGATCPLALTSVSLNDGAIQTQTAAGSFAVNVVFDTSGTVRFWSSNAAVPGVLCTLQGDRVYTGTSGSNGTFTVAGAEDGSYTLTPSKSDDANGISAYDASLILQHDAGLITLSGRAATAADVNKSGEITSFDAFHVLQKAVDLITLPFPGAGQVWAFDPANRSYAGLGSSQSGQDFTAILLGDVSGNWWPSSGSPAPPSGGGTKGPKDQRSEVTLALRSLTSRSNGTQVWLLAKVQDSAIYSLDLVLTNTLSHGLVGLSSGTFAETMAMSSNTNSSGEIRVALAGAVPLQGVGVVLILTLPEGDTNGLSLVSASVNEGAVPVVIVPGSVAFDEDSDGDGQSDWSEVRAGTGPTDKGSYFALRSVTLENGQARRISWSTVPGRSYQLLRLDLGMGDRWETLGPTVTATGATATLLDDSPNPVSGRFYRVQLVE